jgi:diguanylate cyclase (GGDEF)-like protein
MNAGLPEQEQARLKALERYAILDTEAEQAYDDITRLAAAITNTPIALISLVDEHRQWFKSRVGIEATETPREIAFCAHAIRNPEHTLIVPDATQDPRFADNPLVTSAPHIRFYAGEPLVTSDHHALGTLCVMDNMPRELTPDQKESLAALSRLVVAQLEMRYHAAQLHALSARQAHTLEQLKNYQRQLEEANARLEERSLTDKLTGVANRAGFDQRLHEEIERCKRYGSQLSLLMLDMDHFKHYNDTYGHLAGDEALTAASRTMQEVCRPVDVIARYGGEEFAVILPTTDRDGAIHTAERLRQAIAATPLGTGSITVSIGISTLDSTGKPPRQLIQEADEALYEAKGSGRNRVIHFDTL